jgi:hypothetical protein
LSKNELIFEDKLIIENALGLWVGCVLHRNELFNEFYSFKYDGDKNCQDFIMSGLLYNSYDKIREEFKLALSALARKLLNTEKIHQLPLLYLLKLLSSNFSLITQFHCK